MRRKQFAGFAAKVIQHESEHLQGMLFIDHLVPMKKKPLNPDYAMNILFIA